MDDRVWTLIELDDELTERVDRSEMQGHGRASVDDVERMAREMLDELGVECVVFDREQGCLVNYATRCIDEIERELD